QTHLSSLVERLDKRRFEVTVACSFTGPLIDSLKGLGVRVYELQNLVREISLINDFKTTIQLIKFCRKEKFDILHAHSSKAGFLGRIAAYVARVPVIIFSVHGFAFTPENPSVMKKIFTAIEFFCGKISSKVICVSGKDMEYALKEGILSSDRVSNIANGVDIERFANGKGEKIREEFDLKYDDIVVGMVTRLVDAKGCREFIESARILFSKHPNIRFLLIGEGPDELNYRDLVTKLELGKKFIFTGLRSDIPDMLAAMDIFVLPSYTEALPYAVIEAMSAGKPVITTSVGGIPELITDGVEGFLLQPKDAKSLVDKIEILLEDEKLRMEFGKAAKKRIKENYFLDKTVNMTTSLYRNILGDVHENLENKIPLIFGFGDMLMLHLSIILAFVFWFGFSIPHVNFSEYTDYWFSISIIGFLCFYFFGMYDKPQESIHETVAFPMILKSATVIYMTLVLVRFLNKDYFDLRRPVFVMSWLLTLVLCSLTRKTIAQFFRLPQTHKRVLIVGKGEEEEDLVAEIKRRIYLGYEIVGFVVDAKEDKIPELLDIKYLGKTDEIMNIVKEHQVDLVITGFPKTHSQNMIENMIQSFNDHLEIDLIPSTFDLMTGKATTKLIGDIPLVAVATKNYSISRSIHIKNFIDKITSILFLILTSPLLLVFAIIIKLTSKGPVIYRQLRVGKDEKLFTMYKLRTMVEDAEKQTGPVLADEEDKRLTTIGRFLRKYSLDELPQLFNVLKGNMSLVGPRPERPHFVKEFLHKNPAYRERFKMKPGLTGLAQVNGSYKSKFYNKLKYDLLYIYSYSLFRDFLIIKDTIKMITTGKKL
ncbi:exopolysaccharide biosynthesis polyprenyl glycosylphosphotransferase, partial [bacterium]|nr:exopolysaccharide biosynthesis polyprenyl glycosylphosphotransferase [bacterium]